MSMKCPPPHLRGATEKQLAESPPSEVSARSDKELLHELQVHQIELEMQNEALRQAQVELEKSRDRFVDFYEFAPVGYLTLTDKGLIADINTTGAALLGAERSNMLTKPLARFVKTDDADRWHSHFFGVLKTDEKLTCELALLRVDGSHVDVRLDSLRLIKDGQTPALRVVLTDITERKKAEDELQKNQALLVSITEGTTDAVYAKDTEGRYLLFNDAASHYVGRSAEAVLGKDDTALFPPREAREVMAADHQIIASGDTRTYEEFVSTLAGPTTFEATKGPIRNAQGDITGLFGIARNITERKKAEDALRKSEERYRLLVETASEGILVAQGARLKFVNPMVMEITGYTEDELISTPFMDFIHPDDRELMASNYVKRLKGEVVAQRYPIRVLTKESGEKWVEMSGARTEWEGQPATLNFVNDITQRKQAEEALRESELRFSLFMENLPACAYIKDAQGRHIFVNAALASQTMATVGSLLGKTQGDLWPKEIAAKLDSADAAVIASGSPLTIEEDVLMNNAVRSYLTTKFSIERANGETFLAGVSFDITERKRAEAELTQYRSHLEELVAARTAELEQSRDAAEAGNRAKTIFLANMSHELRTPMNGVMGMIDLVLMRATDPKQIDWLNKSKRAAQRMVNVVSDILDFSKIEAERLPLEEKNFSLTQMIDDVIVMQDLIAEAKGLKLIREITATFPDQLSGDAFRLRQILLNLLGNACKFSDQGTITVRASAVEQDDESVLVRIEVEDQGIGISPEQQAMLFQAFTQVDGSITRKYGGSGLGLIISKRLANLMGGDVGMVSQEGRGSTFWATVRLKPAKASEVGI